MGQSSTIFLVHVFRVLLHLYNNVSIHHISVQSVVLKIHLLRLKTRIFSQVDELPRTIRSSFLNGTGSNVIIVFIQGYCRLAIFNEHLSLRLVSSREIDLNLDMVADIYT